jgi:hypothetical protein
MAIQILKGATDISGGIDWKSLRLTSVLTKEKGTLAFDILNVNGAVIPTFGDTIYLYYNNVLLFGGTCTEKQIVIDGGILQRYKITCQDWGYKFDSKLVHKAYQNMDPKDIVLDIVANFAGAGFTTNNVQRGNFQVSSIKFNYEQPIRAIEALAKQIGWDWYIDPNKDVHFFFANPSSGTSQILPAPFNIEDGTGNIQFKTLSVDMSIANLKNSIYVVGGLMYRFNTLGNTPDVYQTHAGQVVYPIAYPYDTSNLVGGTLSVSLDGVPQSIGIDGQTDPGTVNVLYNGGSGGGAQGGSPFIRFTSDPGSGHTLLIYGNASIPIVCHLTNPTSIRTYGEQQDSIVDKQIKSVQEAQARADAELIQFDHPVYDVKFDTLTDGLFIGQSIKLNSANLGISNYPLIIKRIEADGYSPDKLIFHVQCLGSDNVTFTDIMMTLLQQTLAQNATPDNTILQVVLPISEQIKITDAVTITSGSAPYGYGPTSPQPTYGFASFK